MGAQTRNTPGKTIISRFVMSFGLLYCGCHYLVGFLGILGPIVLGFRLLPSPAFGGAQLAGRRRLHHQKQP